MRSDEEAGQTASHGFGQSLGRYIRLRRGGSIFSQAVNHLCQEGRPLDAMVLQQPGSLCQGDSLLSRDLTLHDERIKDTLRQHDRQAGDLRTGLVRDVLALTEAGANRPIADPARLVDQVDFTSATMAELLTIRNIADRIGGVAYAHAWSSRCGRGRNPWGAANHNAAGKLLNSLGDALTEVETAAEMEAKRCKVSGEDERTARLYLLAPATIDTGDPDEIEAFARELLAHAEAERTRG